MATASAGQFHVSVIRAPAAIYADPLSQAIHRFKYEGRAGVHEPLGQLLASYWRDRRPRSIWLWRCRCTRSACGSVASISPTCWLPAAP